MAQNKHRLGNAAQSWLSIPPYPEDTFGVRAYASHASLGDNFCYQIDVQCEAPLDLNALLLQPAILSFNSTQALQKIHGLVIKASHQQGKLDGYTHRITIASPLEILKHNSNNRSFIDANIKDVITTILNPLKHSLPIEWQLSKTYPKLDYMIQWNESDYNFLRRLLFGLGISFYFVFEDAQTKCIFFDDISKLSNDAVTLNFVPNAGMERLDDSVITFEPHLRLLPKSLQTHNHDALKNTTQTLNVNGQNGSGIFSSFSEQFFNQDFNQLRNNNLQNAIEGQRHTIVATSDCAYLTPGMCFILSSHEVESYNRSYRIVQSDTQMQTADADIDPIETENRLPYINTLLLIPADTHYGPNPIPNPHFHGTITATIVSDTQNAMLEGDGRYRVRMPFDNQQSMATTPPITFVQPYGGHMAGYHHPLLDGTHVAVGCMNGDLNQPIILGAMPSEQVLSPVTQANNTEHVVSSATGHKLSFDDNPNKKVIHVQTAGQQNQITLHEDKDSSVIHVNSQGDINFSANKNITRNITTEHTSTAKNSNITVGQLHSLLTGEGDITHNSGDALNMHAKQTITLATDKADITQMAKENITHTANQNISQHSSEGNIQYQSGNDVLMQSRQNIHIHNIDATQPIGIHAGGQTLQLHNQNAIINANNITISAPTINIHGNVSKNQGGNGNSNAEWQQTQEQVSTLQQQNQEMYVHGPEFLKEHTKDIALNTTNQINHVDINSEPNSFIGEQHHLKKNNTQFINNPPYPQISFDLDLIPPMQGNVIISGVSYIYTIKFSGNLKLQKQGIHKHKHITINPYKLEARNTLGKFFADMKLTVKNKNTLELGSMRTGEYETDLMRLNNIYNITFIADSKPVIRTLNEWSIQGNLSYIVNLQHNDRQNFTQKGLFHHESLFNTWSSMEKTEIMLILVSLGPTISSIIESLEFGALS